MFFHKPHVVTGMFLRVISCINDEILILKEFNN